MKRGTTKRAAILALTLEAVFLVALLTRGVEPASHEDIVWALLALLQLPGMWIVEALHPTENPWIALGLAAVIQVGFLWAVLVGVMTTWEKWSTRRSA